MPDDRRPPLLAAALARVGTRAAFTRILDEESPVPKRTPDAPEPADFTPEPEVAAAAGIPEADIGRYQQAETQAGTGLLPPAEWAQALGHTAPDPAALLRVGIPPGQPITWLLYATLRETIPSVTPGKKGT